MITVNDTPEAEHELVRRSSRSSEPSHRPSASEGLSPAPTRSELRTVVCSQGWRNGSAPARDHAAEATQIDDFSLTARTAFREALAGRRIGAILAGTGSSTILRDQAPSPRGQ
jgi:hypothetical protein